MDGHEPARRAGVFGVVPRWFANRPLRFKVLLPVAIGALVIIALNLVGLTAISSTSSSAHRLYSQAALPLDALGHVRDAEGDSRVAVRQYILATNATDRAAAKSDAATADTALDQSVAGYRSAKGSSLSAQRADLLDRFVAAVRRWRTIRKCTGARSARGAGRACRAHRAHLDRRRSPARWDAR